MLRLLDGVQRVGTGGVEQRLHRRAVRAALRGAVLSTACRRRRRRRHRVDVVGDGGRRRVTGRGLGGQRRRRRGERRCRRGLRTGHRPLLDTQLRQRVGERRRRLCGSVGIVLTRFRRPVRGSRGRRTRRLVRTLRRRRGLGTRRVVGTRRGSTECICLGVLIALQLRTSCREIGACARQIAAQALQVEPGDLLPTANRLAGSDGDRGDGAVAGEHQLAAPVRRDGAAQGERLGHRAEAGADGAVGRVVVGGGERRIAATHDADRRTRGDGPAQRTRPHDVSAESEPGRPPGPAGPPKPPPAVHSPSTGSLTSMLVALTAPVLSLSP